MKKGWKVKQLDEVCSFGNGLWTGKKPPFQRVGVLRSTNFTNEGFLDYLDIVYLDVESSQFEKRRLSYGDIILEKSGGGPKQPVGRVVLFDKRDGDYSHSNFTSSIRIKDSNVLDFRFLHLFLFAAHLSGMTESMQTNSTNIRNLKLDQYKSIAIPLPPLPEQQRIVAILDKAFAAIAKAKANAEQNLKNARELFESYLQGVFEQRGEGWVKTSLESEIHLLAGFAFKSADYTEKESDIRLLRGDNIVQGAMRWEDVKRWNASELDDFEKFQLHENDIVLAMDRPWVKAGLKCARLTKMDVPSLLVQRTARLRNLPGMDGTFLYHLIRSKQFSEHLLGVQTGIGVPHISAKQILSFGFYKPPLREQLQIVQKLDTLQAETKRLEVIYQQKLAALEELKKTLLQKAFRGELDTE